MSRIVIYHAGCVDGFTAAWCAHELYGDTDTTYLPAHYGDEPPDVLGLDVLIVDFSYPRRHLVHMADIANSIRVLDHHKTAKADLEGLDFCTFDMDRSGAGLAWDELFGGLGKRLPLIDFVEDRDLWRWELPESREVSAYIATVERTFPEWSRLSTSLAEHDGIVADWGRLILRVTNQYVDSISKRPGRAFIGGHNVPIVNTTFAVSELVGKLAETAPFAVGWFEKDDGKIVYSLRSRGADGLDVSEIAKQYGGGGHRNAAGFTTDEPIHRAAWTP